MAVEVAVVIGSGVGVSVEVHESNAAVSVNIRNARGIRKRDCVVAPENQGDRPGPADPLHRRGDEVEALLEVARRE